MVRRVYANMLARRLRDDAAKAERLGDAFRRIQAATGLGDVDAIVIKYTSREATVAALAAQMRSARDRVDALHAERRQLVWALDEAALAAEGSLDARALFAGAEAFDRRLAEEARRLRESRGRLDRVSLLLEGCRACIAKLLERVGLHEAAESIAGVVAGTTADSTAGGSRAPSAKSGIGRSELSLAAAMPATGLDTGAGTATPQPPGARGRSEAATRSRRGSAASAGAGVGAGSGRSPGERRASLSRSSHRSGGAGSGGAAGAGHGDASAGGAASSGTSLVETAAAAHSRAAAEATSQLPGSRVVQPEQLESALAQLERQVSVLLAQLAAVFEREEAAASAAGRSRGKGKNKSRLSAAGSAAGSAASSAASTSSAARGAPGRSLDAASGGAGAMDAGGPGGARRLSLGALAERASPRMYLRLMTMTSAPDDVDGSNVRVATRRPTPPPAAHAAAQLLFGLPPVPGAIGGAAGPGGAHGPMTTSAVLAAHNAAHLTKLLAGGGAGAVVDRAALKRLSAAAAAAAAGTGAGASGARGAAGRRVFSAHPSAAGAGSAAADVISAQASRPGTAPMPGALTPMRSPIAYPATPV